MPRKRSRLQSQLDDSSSDDDESFFLSAAAIVDTFSSEEKNMVARFQAIELFTVIEKAGTRGCLKIIWIKIQRTALKCSVGGLCSFISY